MATGRVTNLIADRESDPKTRDATCTKARDYFRALRIFTAGDDEHGGSELLCGIE
ncbi:MAG: hypothetical protein O2943_05370 [Actinomycetota bacterium]|nr:hypothetical protein [Actinomycetota bacterium]